MWPDRGGSVRSQGRRITHSGTIAVLALIVSILGTVTVPRLTAQVVQVQTVDTMARTAAPSTVVSLLRAGSDQILVRILTDAQGRGAVSLSGPGTYQLRVDRIGYVTTLTAPFTVHTVADTLIQRIALNPERFLLPEVDVVVGNVACGTGGVAGPELAAVWEEARKTLTVTALTATSVRPLLDRWRWERTLTVRGRLQGESPDAVQYTRDAPFVTVSPARLRESGFADVGRDQALFYLPDATVLLDEAFLETHCFRLDTEERRSEGLLGLRFAPLPDRTVPDIEGVLWIRRNEAILREITFHYANLPSELQAHHPGGKVSLAPIADGGWIVDEWYVQTPVLGAVRDGSFTGRRSPDRRGGALVAWHVAGGKARAVPSSAGDEGEVSAPGNPGVCGPTPVSGGGLGVVVVQVVEEGPRRGAVAETPVVVTAGESAAQMVRVGDGRGLRVERPAVRVEGISDGDGLVAFCGIPIGTRLAVQAGKAETQATLGKVEGSLTEIQVRVPAKAVVAAAPPRLSPLLRGRVVDTAGAGLAAVEVALEEAGRRTVTDEAGRYEVRDVPPGRYQVVFRRIGYQPLTVFRSFLRDTVVVDAQLAAEAFVLPELETKARGPEEVPVKLREWARRREFNGGGKFWDDSLLRTQEHRQLPEILQGISGVRIIRALGGRFLATGGGRAGVSLGRNQGDPRGDLRQVPRACYATIFLDGVRLAFTGTPPNLDDIPIDQIAAMEFYRSASEMPVELNSPGSICGVLAIWTRVGGR